MDIKILSHILKQLIISNNKVLLPGLGSFIVEEMPSSLLNDGATITAPYSTILFKNFEIHNDGILEEAFVKRFGFSNEQSRKEINLLVSDIKKRLIADSTVEFPGFGTLSFSEGFQFVFVPDKVFFDDCNLFESESIKMERGGESFLFADNGIAKEVSDVSEYSTEKEIVSGTEVDKCTELSDDSVVEKVADVKPSEEGDAEAKEEEVFTFDLGDEPVITVDSYKGDKFVDKDIVSSEEGEGNSGEKEESEINEKEVMSEKNEVKEDDDKGEENGAIDFEKELSIMVNASLQKETITIDKEKIEDVYKKVESCENERADEIVAMDVNEAEGGAEADVEADADADVEVEREGEETNSVGDSDGENDDRPEGSGGTIENNKEAETSKTTKILKVIFIITIVIALLLVIATLIYIFKEPLKPLLERIFYSKEEIDMVHSLGL